MAKVTKPRDVSFGSLEGRDPAGVGVPDMRTTVWSPADFTQKVWRDAALKRERELARRQEQYDRFVEQLPEYEGLNAKVTAELRHDVERMRQLAEQKMLAGPFFSFARTEQGLKAQEELAKMEKQIIDKGAKYEEILPFYQAAEEYVKNPENRGKFYEDLTLEKMRRFNELDDMDQMNRMKDDLVVMRPEQQDIYKYAMGILDEVKQKGGYTEDADISLENGMYSIVTTETYNPQMVHEYFVRGYRFADEPMQRVIQERYEDAPPLSKVTDEGVKIPVEDWWANQFSGLLGDRKTATTTPRRTYNDRTGRKTTFGVGSTENIPFPGSDVDTTQPMQTQILSRQTLAKTKWGSGEVKRKKGNIQYQQPGQWEQQVMDVEYTAPYWDLSGLTVEMMRAVPPNTIDLRTGGEGETNKTAYNRFAGFRLWPVFVGDKPETIKLTGQFDPEQKAFVETQITLEPERPIPNEALPYVSRDKVEFRPYVETRALFDPELAADPTRPFADTDYVSRNVKTYDYPLEKISPALIQGMYEQELTEKQVKAIYTDLQNLLNQWNNELSNMTLPPTSIEEQVDAIIDELPGIP